MSPVRMRGLQQASPDWSGLREVRVLVVTEVDDRFREWVLAKFYQQYQHSPKVECISVDAEWECGCYSEYTRDDHVVARAIMKRADGSTFPFDYYYDIPDVIMELVGENDCQFEEE